MPSRRENNAIDPEKIAPTEHRRRTRLLDIANRHGRVDLILVASRYGRHVPAMWDRLAASLRRLSLR